MGDELQAKHEGLKSEVTTAFNELFGEAGKCVEDEERFWQGTGEKYVAFRKFADEDVAPWVPEDVKAEGRKVQRAVSDTEAVSDIRRTLKDVDASNVLERGFSIKTYLENQLEILMEGLSNAKGPDIATYKQDLLAAIQVGMDVYEGVFPAYDAFYSKVRLSAIKADAVMNTLRGESTMPVHESRIQRAATLMHDLKETVMDRDPTLKTREQSVLENMPDRYDVLSAALDAYAAALSE